MQSLNSLLANTTSHFTDTSLCEKLKAGLDPKLTHHCNANKVDKILVLCLWALKVKHNDKNHWADLKQAQEVTEEVFNRCENSGKCHCNDNRPVNTITYTVNPNTATTAAIMGTIQHLAALTGAKWKQLNSNHSY